MYYNVEPVFVLFPILCLLVHFTKLREKKEICYLLIVLFILLYSFSLNGSDFEGYYAHYRMVEGGASPAENDQEIGFYYLMKGAVSLGLDYLTFRIIFLSFLSFVLFYSIRKFSNDFALSLFFISSMFVIYTISAYRQFIVIAFSLYWIYVYCHGKEKIALLGVASLLLFHMTAILPLGCMIFDSLRGEKKADRSSDTFSRYFFIVLVLALTVRVVAFVLLKTSAVNAILDRLIGKHASADPTIFSFGLLSRLIFLTVISLFYRLSNTGDRSVKFLYWYYFVSIMIYIAIPLEFFMGRLMNNASILSAVLVPMLMKTDVLPFLPVKIKYKDPFRRVFLFVLEVTALAVLINQLLKQDGYTPYLNILLGDKPV